MPPDVVFVAAIVSIVVSISPSPDVPIPLSAVKVTLVESPKIFEVSPVKLSVIVPDVAVIATEPSASTLDSNTFKLASNTIAPLSEPSMDEIFTPSVWVIKPVVPLASRVIKPPADTISAPWAISEFADVKVIVPSALFVIFAVVVITASEVSIIAPAVPVIALFTVTDLSVPVSFASNVTLPAPTVDIPVPAAATTIFPFSVVKVVLPENAAFVWVMLSTFTSEDTAFTLILILPSPVLLAVKLVISVYPRSIPVEAVTVKSFALNDSEDNPSFVSFCCLILPDSEYKIIFAELASISFLISILLTASKVILPDPFKILSVPE